jgi:hypothetical protein
VEGILAEHNAGQYTLFVRIAKRRCKGMIGNVTGDKVRQENGKRPYVIRGVRAKC